jgi:hypothetical protein
MGRLRTLLKNLKRDARGELESFVLEDGSRYYYDRLETYRELFLHAYDVQLGEADKWPEPPEVYRKICEARDPAAILKRLAPSEASPSAFVDVAQIFDTAILVNERRLVMLENAPVEDLSG